MTTAPATVAPTAADRAARRNWEANVAALAARQPWAIAELGGRPGDVEWVFGRDGSLTCRDGSDSWFAGCSIPRRAGEAMLRNLELRGVVGCFLLPSHAGAVAAALAKVRPQQAVVVVEPDLTAFRVMLASQDFSDAIRSNRVWFAAGPEWPRVAETLFDRVIGLPTPTQFIRTGTATDEAIGAMIPVAERVIRSANNQRAQRVRQRLATGNSAGRPRLLVLAPSHFRLWDDAGHALASALRDGEAATVTHVDPDNPAQASAAGLAWAACDADVIVLPNRTRGELPADAVPANVRVITWMTEPRVPAFDRGFPTDGLLLADETWMTAAQRAGWPKARLDVAGWPTLEPSSAGGDHVALIADTRSLDTPVDELDLSSHHVLWEMIRTDLRHDPLSLGADVGAFLNRRMAKLGISEEGFDRTRFVQQLIQPAYQQGLARLLIDGGVPLRVYGRGWDEVGFAANWGGPVDDREAFTAAVANAAALVHAWPARHRHAIDGCGRPVIFTPGRDPKQWVRAARSTGQAIPLPPSLLDSLAVLRLAGAPQR